MTVSSRNGRLTPDQVQSISFPPARFGRRGLDEETVHSFCDQVQHELVTLLNEKASLWEEVERLRRRIIDSGDPSGARPEDAHIQAVRILANAQQMADKYVADAQEYSRQITTDARRRDEVLAEAKTHAERVLDEAHSRASRAADVVSSEPGPPASGEWRDGTAELAYLGPSARSTAPTCGPTWKPCSTTWRTGSSRRRSRWRRPGASCPPPPRPGCRSGRHGAAI